MAEPTPPQKPLTISPSAIDMELNSACQFTVDPPGSKVTWSITPKVGKIDESDGTYTSPIAIARPKTVIVRAASGDSSATARISLSDTPSRIFWLGWYAITVGVLLAAGVLAGWSQLYQAQSAPRVIVNPQIVTLNPAADDKFPFAATALGDPKNGVSWSIDKGGKIDSTGMFQKAAETKPDAKDVLTITARSDADRKQSGTATVHLLAGKHLEIMPQLSTVLVGQQVLFRTTNPKVKWTVSRPLISSITSDGFFTAGSPEKEELVQVTAAGDTPDELAAIMLRITPLTGVSDAPHWPVMLFVMVCGALGSMVYYATSFVGYVGNQTFCSSWFWFYISRPFVGGALAVIFFFIAGSGMINGTTGAEITKIGMISALVGLFSDKAVKKLSDILDVLLATTNDDRKDKVDAKRDSATAAAGLPAIASSKPPNIPPNQDASVEIKGTNLKGPGFKLKVNGADATPTNHTEQGFTLSIPATQAQAPALTIVVTTDRGTVTFSLPVKA